MCNRLTTSLSKHHIAEILLSHETNHARVQPKTGSRHITKRGPLELGTNIRAGTYAYRATNIFKTRRIVVEFPGEDDWFVVDDLMSL
jgi:hypothetical protein